MGWRSESAHGKPFLLVVLDVILLQESGPLLHWIGTFVAELSDVWQCEQVFLG